MRDEHAELSSTATLLADLIERVSDAADRLQSAKQESAAAELYEVERSLRGANRRLSALLRRSS